MTLSLAAEEAALLAAIRAFDPEHHVDTTEDFLSAFRSICRDHADEARRIFLTITTAIEQETAR